MAGFMAGGPVQLDVLIFGGGIAGLWLLDELSGRGCRALLLESQALGTGQTIGSQGIIHGGLKYMFDGKVNPSARAIAEMPELWRACLRGEMQPDLSAVKVRSEHCFIWGTGSIKSRVMLAGSSVALRAAPEAVEKDQWPAALYGVSGRVLRVPEPVLNCASLLEVLAERNRERILWVEAQDGQTPVFERRIGGEIIGVKVRTRDGVELELRPQHVVLCAGEGNGPLRRAVGLSEAMMQKRPLHMAMARGALPPLYGHFIGYPRPRITVTSVVDAQGRAVWQVGGQIAEDGVEMSAAELAAHAKRELTACVAGIDFSQAEFSSYRANRAEAATESGHKPDEAHVQREANVITAFPTKLALAPRLAARVIEILSADDGGGALAAWQKVEASRPRAGDMPRLLASEHPAPPVATPPWDAASAAWISGRELG